MVFKFKLTTQVQLESLESNARTFGELKRDIQSSNLAGKIDFSKTTTQRDGVQWVSTIKLIDKNSQVEYGSFDDAVLPQANNVIFFVLPFEHKGGMAFSEIDDIVENLENETFESFEEIVYEYGYNELRSLGSKLNSKYNASIDLSGKKDDLYDNILNWVELFYEELEEESECPACIPDAIELIKSATDYLVQAVELLENATDNNNYYADTTTLTDLHTIAIELQRQLNK